MPRDILSEYGRDSGPGQGPSATNGGKMPVRDVMNYSSPKGPIGIMQKGIGAGANDCGCGMGGSNEHLSGGPGSGGTNHGNAGSQGRR